MNNSPDPGNNFKHFWGRKDIHNIFRALFDCIKVEKLVIYQFACTLLPKYIPYKS